MTDESTTRGFGQGRFDGRVKRVDAAVAAVGAGLVALALLGAVAGTLWVGRTRAAVAPASAAFELNGLVVRVPGAWSHEASPDPTKPQRVERLELQVPLAELLPQAQQSPALVGIALTGQDGTPAPAERPALLYARFLSAEAAASTGGLIRRAFRAGTPFEGETLHLAPPDGRLFAARCLADRADDRLLTGSCLAEIRLKHFDVQVRFAPALLDEWQPLLDGLRRTFGDA